ncbi:MAG: carboxypeptidase-like regulatory domain-containing protein, partial [Planctomycetota bacterium]
DRSREALLLLAAGRGILSRPTESGTGSTASTLAPAAGWIAAGAAVLAAGSIAILLRTQDPTPTRVVSRAGEPGPTENARRAEPSGQPAFLPEEGRRASLAAAPGKGEPEAATAAEPGAGIAAEGVVFDPAGHPVAGASLWVVEGGPRATASISTWTDAGGRFRIEGLSLESEIGAVAEGWAPSILQPLRGRPGETWPVRIQLERPGTDVAGSVTDAAGAPIPGASLRIGSEHREVVLLPDTREGHSPPPLQAVSDARGEFRIGSVPLGRQTIQARAPWFGTAALALEVPPEGLRGVRLVLAQEARVLGRVVSPGGAPVAGARVKCGDPATFAASTAASDLDGRFELAGLPEGPAYLVAEHALEGFAHARLELLPGATQVWEPTLAPTPRIRGTLLDESGRPLEGWSIALCRAGQDGAVATAASDPEGRFLFPHLCEPRYDLVVHGRDAWMELPFLVERNVRPGGERTLRLRDLSAATGTIVGRAVGPAGEPVSGTMVTGWHAEDEAHSWYGITPDAGSGAFEIARVPPGHLLVTVRSADWAPLSLGPKEVKAGERIDLGILRLGAPGFLHGSLLGAADEDLDRLSLRILDAEGEPAGSVRRIGRTYRSSPLGPGSYTLLVKGDAFETVREPFTLGTGEDRGLDARLSPAGLMRVLLVAEKDLSEAWTWCRVLDGSGATRWTWGGRVPREGREIRVSVAPGEYRLRVESTAGSSAEVPISIRGYVEEASVLRVDLR